MTKTKKQSTKSSLFKRVGNKKGLITAGIIGVLIILFIVAQFFQGNNVESSAEETYSIHILNEEDPILFDGTVQASEVQEAYYDPTEGVIAEILVEDGQTVEEGSDLFTYTNEENQQLLNEQTRQYSRLETRRSEMQTELANARASLNTANANIEEANRILQSVPDTDEEGMEINTDFETAQTNLMSYESDKAEAEAVIDNADSMTRELNEQMEDIQFEIDRLRGEITTTVQADFTGIIELNSTKSQDYESGERPVIRLLSEETKIDATISEYDYEKIEEGNEVDISLVNSDRELTGRITQISRSPLQLDAEGTSTRYEFEVLPDSAIQYGFSVRIGFHEGVIYLPQSVVLEEDDGQSIVFVNNDGVVERREVEVTEDGSLYVLESGLELDEEIVLDPSSELSDGDEILVMYD